MLIRLIEDDNTNPSKQNSNSTDGTYYDTKTDLGKLAKIIDDQSDSGLRQQYIEKYLSVMFPGERFDPETINLIDKDVQRKGTIPQKSDLDSNRSDTTLQFIYTYKKDKGNIPPNQFIWTVGNLLNQQDKTTKDEISDRESFLYRISSDKGQGNLYKWKAYVFLSNPRNVRAYFDDNPWNGKENAKGTTEKQRLQNYILSTPYQQLRHDLSTQQTKNGDDRISVADYIKNKTDSSTVHEEALKLYGDTDIADRAQKRYEYLINNQAQDLEETKINPDADIPYFLSVINKIRLKETTKERELKLPDTTVDMQAFNNMSKIYRDIVAKTVNLLNNYVTTGNGRDIKFIWDSYVDDETKQVAVANVLKNSKNINEDAQNLPQIIVNMLRARVEQSEDEYQQSEQVPPGYNQTRSGILVPNR